MKTYTPPPDKSITIRALLLAAAGSGAARVENPLYCADTEAAIFCLESLGVKLRRDGNAVVIEGRGLKGFKKPGAPLDAGESAALARMLAGLLAGQTFASVITGRGTLLNRPMAATAAALKKLGAKIDCKGGKLPLAIKPAKLKGGKVSGVESAQVKSALLLAGLQAAGAMELKEKFPTRDHTERLLVLMGAKLSTKGAALRLEPGPLTARPVTVPGDISSAAPFIAAALLAGQPLKVIGCGLNPKRLGFITALQKMGAKVTLKPADTFPEPSGEIEVLPSPLTAIKITPAEIPAMIDEVPLLALLAAKAAGTTAISGIENLKAKESDRVDSVLAMLAALGVKASYRGGTLFVTGAGRFRPVAPVDTFNDHRMAMAAAAALAACPGLAIKNPACVGKSYPAFWEDFKKVFGFYPAGSRK